MEKCPECGQLLTKEMIDVNMCWNCGYIIDRSLYEIDDETLDQMEQEEQAKEKEEIRKLQAAILEKKNKAKYGEKRKQRYEYATDYIVDNKGGGLDIRDLSKKLNEYAAFGWELNQIYTNELGKNQVSISIGNVGGGSNSTIDMHILIFRRPVD